MKHITSFLIIAIVFISGFGHAGTFEQGMAFYEKRNYAQARKLWQPLARKGDVRAQYNLALTWIKEEKELPKASEYLVMSRSEGLVDSYFLKLPKAKPKKPKKKSVSQTKSSNTSKTKTKAALTKAELWLNQQEKSHYTLQLATARNRLHMEKMLKKYQKDQKLIQSDSLFIQEIKSTEKKAGKEKIRIRYVLVYGVFESYQQAKTEVSKLPESLQKSSPWIRQFSVLQSIVNSKQL